MSNSRLLTPLFFLALVFSAFTAHAQYVAADEPFDVAFSAYRLPASGTGTSPDSVLVVLEFTPSDGWYAYAADHTGGVGRPPRILAEVVPGGAKVAPLLPPGVTKPDPFDPAKTMRVYTGETPFFLPLPAGTTPPLRLKMRMGLALCQDTKCRETMVEMVYPLRSPDIAALPDATEQSWWPLYRAAADLGPQLSPGGAPPSTPRFTPAAGEVQGWHFTPEFFRPEMEVTGLLSALLLGLLAGLILNVMPCVLPVVSLKLSGLLAGGGLAETDKRAAFREHNIFFSLGVLAYFAFLAALLAATGMAWGELFQKPLLVTVLSAVVLALSLSLLGVFNLPVIDLKLGARSENPALQAFFTGVLATLLATPCSGPFLGGVLGWALLRPAQDIAVVFLSVGLGMTLPYLLMAALPGLARFFPRPGAWTGYVERAAGFFLLATAAYLVNILPQAYLGSALTLLWVTALASWLWGLGGPAASTRKRIAVRGTSALLVAAALVWISLPRSAGFIWEEFDEARLRGRIGNDLVVADFTADWCPTCKFLEQTVLADDNVREWTENYDAVFVRVDLTDDDPAAESLLRALGSRSIPLLAVFPRGGASKRPIVLRDLFTESQLEQALQRAARR